MVFGKIVTTILDDCLGRLSKRMPFGWAIVVYALIIVACMAAIVGIHRLWCFIFHKNPERFYVVSREELYGGITSPKERKKQLRALRSGLLYARIVKTENPDDLIYRKELDDRPVDGRELPTYTLVLFYNSGEVQHPRKLKIRVTGDELSCFERYIVTGDEAH